MPPLQFWKPGPAGPGSTLDRESESEGSLLSGPITNKVNASLSLASQRTRLPIYKHREKLLYCVEKYGCVIVVGQTGCGKSTRKCRVLVNPVELN
jgi:ATP-dependent RNA helicase DDX35